MAASLRPIRSLAPVVVFAGSIVFAFGCSSSPPGLGGEGGHREAEKRRDEPLFEGADARAKSAADREATLARFFAQRSVSFTAAAESAWMAFDGEGAVVVTIKNGGSKRLTLLGERSVGIWPLDHHRERARAVLRVVVTQASLAGGVQHGEDTLFDDSIDTVVVEPGGERSLRLPVALRFATEGAGGSTATLAASVSVRAELHPLALQFDGEPERVCALPFGEVVLHYAPARVAAAAPEDHAPFEVGLAADPDLLVAAALRAAAEDPAGVVARLISSLPGPDPKARRARFIALEWITRRRFGDDVERWRGWWDSDEGMRFGRRDDGGRG